MADGVNGSWGGLGTSGGFEGRDGIEMAYNSAFAVPRIAVRVRRVVETEADPEPVGRWITPVSPAQGRLSNGQTTTVNVTLNAAMLAVGTHNETLRLLSNDPRPAMRSTLPSWSKSPATRSVSASSSGEGVTPSSGSCTQPTCAHSSRSPASVARKRDFPMPLRADLGRGLPQPTIDI